MRFYLLRRAPCTWCHRVARRGVWYRGAFYCKRCLDEWEGADVVIITSLIVMSPIIAALVAMLLLGL